MSLQSLITSAAYKLTGSVSFHISSLLPERVHVGKRVGRALQDLRDAPSGPYFMRAVLESRWRSKLILNHVLSLSPAQLRRFFEDRVMFEGAVLAAPMLDGTRPVILAAPHYGPAPIGYVAAVHRVGAHRPINLFYDASRNRLYVTGGEGYLDVVQDEGANKFVRTAHVWTAPGARTSLFVADQSRLYLAVPHRGNQKAAIRVFEAR